MREEFRGIEMPGRLFGKSGIECLGVFSHEVPHGVIGEVFPEEFTIAENPDDVAGPDALIGSLGGRLLGLRCCGRLWAPLELDWLCPDFVRPVGIRNMEGDRIIDGRAGFRLALFDEEALNLVAGTWISMADDPEGEFLNGLLMIPFGDGAECHLMNREAWRMGGKNGNRITHEQGNRRRKDESEKGMLHGARILSRRNHHGQAE